jgi:hypothetical protein
MAKPPAFEKTSKLFGELLIVILYAEAYREAVTHFIEAYTVSGAILRPGLVFATFFFVSVRFFVGNHLLLSDARWDPEGGNTSRWEKDRCTRNLYYLAVFSVVLESLAVILLGALGTVDAPTRSLLWLLIVPSGIDVLWIASQLLLDLRYYRCRPQAPLHRWLFLNLAAIIVFWFLLHCYGSGALSTGILTVITAVNFIAFCVDLFLCNLPNL